jgi:taurine dioxygenase
LANISGELHIHPNTPGLAGNLEILLIRADTNSKRIASGDWHSNVSCGPEQPLGSILYLHTVPRVSGDTQLANMYQAWNALSPQMKFYLKGWRQRHWQQYVDIAISYETALYLVVRTHPLT